MPRLFYCLQFIQVFKRNSKIGFNFATHSNGSIFKISLNKQKKKRENALEKILHWKKILDLNLNKSKNKLKFNSFASIKKCFSLKNC
jgi:hypothetical protein